MNANTTSKTAKALLNSANEATLKYSEIANTLRDAQAIEANATVVAKMRLDMLNAESRAARSQKIIVMSDADSATFATFVAMHKSAEERDAFYKRAIYVQDKIVSLVRALSRNASLSSVTRNNTTRETLRALLNSDTCERKTLLATLVEKCNVTANTASSQVSSSLIALTHCAIVEQDAATKAYSVRKDARAYAELLAA